MNESISEIRQILTPCIREPSKKKIRQEGDLQFEGTLSEEGFRISKISNYPQSFVPLLIGKMVEGEGQTLLRLEFRLFFSSFFLLALWSVICVLAFLFSVFVIENLVYALFTVVIFLGNYLIALSNFRMHSRLSLETLKKVLRK